MRPRVCNKVSHSPCRLCEGLLCVLGLASLIFSGAPGFWHPRCHSSVRTTSGRRHTTSRFCVRSPQLVCARPGLPHFFRCSRFLCKARATDAVRASASASAFWSVSSHVLDFAKNIVTWACGGAELWLRASTDFQKTQRFSLIFSLLLLPCRISNMKVLVAFACNCPGSSLQRVPSLRPSYISERKRMCKFASPALCSLAFRSRRIVSLFARFVNHTSQTWLPCLCPLRHSSVRTTCVRRHTTSRFCVRSPRLVCRAGSGFLLALGRHVGTECKTWRRCT
jgi:hypothetical protein